MSNECLFDFDTFLKDIGLIIEIKDYYELLDYSYRYPNNYCIGQIVSGFISYPTQKQIKMLVPDKKYDPTEQTSAKYFLENFDPKIFNDHSDLHRPIYGDNLKDDEYYIIQKGKKRTCIILNKYKSKFDNPLYNDLIYLCLPTFSLKKKHKNKFIIELLKYEIPDCFYLPPSTPGLNEHCSTRFSRILPLSGKNLFPVQCLNNQNKPIKLSDKALNLLLYHLSKYFSVDFTHDEEISGDIEAYREIINESISIK